MAAPDVLRLSKDLSDYIVHAKRKIHQNPELGMAEFATTEFVRSELKSFGIDVAPWGEGTVGALGLLKGSGPGTGSAIALRADMDALPIQEVTGLPDESKVPGVMHACGHDCHTAMLLGVAKILSGMRDRFAGTVKFLFQPAEETLNGARYMIERGVLDDPKADCIVGLHGHSGFDVGELAFRSGPSMASSDFFTATITGTSGHGAYPHRIQKDPILAASNATLAIQSIITRQVDAIDSVVISICEIHGGSAKNIIPEVVQFGGSVRCQREETRKTIEGRIRDIVNHSAALYKCTADLNYHYGVPPLVNDSDLVAIARESARKIVGDERVRSIDVPAMGSEDFAEYLQVLPRGLFVRLGVHSPGQPNPIFHNGSFVFSEEALPYGTAFFVQFVLDMNGDDGRQ
ncbi:MAG: peptidase M20 [Dethiosulfovibrio peptidovorans]|nr:MAG: peptidase M20 [Dethiosulfovibrio peptidovorans]